MKRINILYIDNTFTFGGAINSLLNLFKALTKEKYCPILITGQPDEFMASHFKRFIYYRPNFKLSWIHNKLYKRIISLRICQNKILLKIINAVRFIYWLICITLPESFRYYRIGERHDVKIVHLNNILGSQLAGIIASKLLNVPCVAHLRHFEETDFITKVYAAMIDHHIAISSAIKENLLNLEVPENKISIVWDAIDLKEFDNSSSYEYLLEEFSINKGEKIFGIFGRIIEWKGIKEFILSADYVFKEVSDAKAFIVGDSSDDDRGYYDSMIALVRNLGLDDKIVFTGFREDVPALMNMMEVVVHASIQPEPFGMVLIEGMAMGKPVVATKAGGPLDIVDNGESGFLADIGDYMEMGKKITMLLKNPALSKNMGNKAKEKVMNYF
ncbi:MAG: glycosyltransferase, partial [Deltaproteobacteria bacterium]|nr:glycosyltransferase [Deltaproteobacteria bacterium]